LTRLKRFAENGSFSFLGDGRTRPQAKAGEDATGVFFILGFLARPTGLAETRGADMRKPGLEIAPRTRIWGFRGRFGERFGPYSRRPGENDPISPARFAHARATAHMSAKSAAFREMISFSPNITRARIV